MRFIYGNSIDSGTVLWMQKLIDKVREERLSDVEIVITSDGGDASVMAVLLKQVAELERIVDVTMVAMGRVASCAAEWFLMFQNRSMSHGSYLLLHNSKFDFDSENPQFIKEATERAKQDDELWFDLFFTGYKIPKNEVNRMKRILKTHGDIIIWSDQAQDWGISK